MFYYRLFEEKHQSVAPEKLIGVVLVAVGLIAGELRLSLQPRGQRL
ncbi:MAG: hypothetical protein R6V86_04230 [Spirochaetia bacterium]